MADLVFSDHVASAEERTAVDALLDGIEATTVEHERLIRAGTQRRRELRHLLLPGLHALQHVAGWISQGGLNYLCERLQVPPAEAFGVASFYDLFKTDQAPTHNKAVTHVCVDGPCRKNSGETMNAVRAAGGVSHPSPCLGQCEGPTAWFTQGCNSADSAKSDSRGDGAVPFRLAQHGEANLQLLQRVGVVDPSSLDSYRAHDGYAALKIAIEAGPEFVLDQLTASGLSGRGGAAFPTGFKWRAVRDASAHGRGENGTAKHIVANADESEPGTFKDRLVLENDPFALVEAMTIAAFTTGASKGWVYIRGEYPLATKRVQNAIDSAREAGLLGKNILDTGTDFDIEIRRGAGAYICGEETALFNSLEGFRGEPRSKPPYPTTNGLFDQPTVINNPETLINVLRILIDGAEKYRSFGTEKSPGTRLFCVSGDVENPGLYEHAFGITLGEVIARAGGVDGELSAVLLGGAAGSFVDGSSLDLAMTLEDTRAAGTTLGSGVVMVFNEKTDWVDTCLRLSEFFRDESCGQCVPCRVGAVRQNEILVELNERRAKINSTDTSNSAASGSGCCSTGCCGSNDGSPKNTSSHTHTSSCGETSSCGDTSSCGSTATSKLSAVGLSAEQHQLHSDIAQVMGDASICGLGHTACSAISSAIELGLIGVSS